MSDTELDIVPEEVAGEEEEWDKNTAEVLSEDDEELYHTRPNRWKGAPSSWRLLTQQDRRIADSLKQEEAQDAAIHLYNDYALRRMELDGWKPPRSWSAWPLPPGEVPRDDLMAFVTEEDQVELTQSFHMDHSLCQASCRRWMEETLTAAILKRGKERFQKRKRKWQEFAFEEPETRQGEKYTLDDTNTKKNKTSAHSEDSGLETESLYPIPATDDEVMSDLLRPIVRHMMVKLGSILSILDNAYISILGHEIPSTTMGDTDDSFWEDEATPANIDPDNSQLTKRKRPAQISQLHEEETELEMKVRMARGRKKKIPTSGNQHAHSAPSNSYSKKEEQKKKQDTLSNITSKSNPNLEHCSTHTSNDEQSINSELRGSIHMNGPEKAQILPQASAKEDISAPYLSTQCSTTSSFLPTSAAGQQGTIGPLYTVNEASLGQSTAQPGESAENIQILHKAKDQKETGSLPVPGNEEKQRIIKETRRKKKNPFDLKKSEQKDQPKRKPGRPRKTPVVLLEGETEQEAMLRDARERKVKIPSNFMGENKPKRGRPKKASNQSNKNKLPNDSSETRKNLTAPEFQHDRSETARQGNDSGNILDKEERSQQIPRNEVFKTSREEITSAMVAENVDNVTTAIRPKLSSQVDKDSRLVPNQETMPTSLTEKIKMTLTDNTTYSLKKVQFPKSVQINDPNTKQQQQSKQQAAPSVLKGIKVGGRQYPQYASTIPLRDWRDVLDAAGPAGFPTAVVARAAQRCANVFGDEYSFLNIDDDGDVTQRLFLPNSNPMDGNNGFDEDHLNFSDDDVEDEGSLYTDTRSVEIDGNDDRSVHNGKEQPSCNEEEDESEDEAMAMEGGIHRDGFMQPIRLRKGWRTNFTEDWARQRKRLWERCCPVRTCVRFGTMRAFTHHSDALRHAREVHKLGECEASAMQRALGYDDEKGWLDVGNGDSSVDEEEYESNEEKDE